MEEVIAEKARRLRRRRLELEICHEIWCEVVLKRVQSGSHELIEFRQRYALSHFFVLFALPTVGPCTRQLKLFACRAHHFLGFIFVSDSVYACSSEPTPPYVIHGIVGACKLQIQRHHNDLAIRWQSARCWGDRMLGRPTMSSISWRRHLINRAALGTQSPTPLTARWKMTSLTMTVKIHVANGS